MAIKIGQTVQLKSGGPIMTITQIEDVNRITCMWYAPTQAEYRTHVFAETWLDEVEIEDEDDEE
jgi:uncharacterized protein YodC (DUF2158 family)